MGCWTSEYCMLRQVILTKKIKFVIYWIALGGLTGSYGWYLAPGVSKTPSNSLIFTAAQPQQLPVKFAGAVGAQEISLLS